MIRRKHMLMVCLLVFIGVFSGCKKEEAVKTAMKLTSSGIVDGVIADSYGKRGTQFFKGMPTYSLPLEIENPPEGTVSYVIVMEDKDAVPPAGFVWIHWLVANLTKTSLKENESIHAADFLQGANSWSASLAGSQLTREESSVYGGMAPPDAPHTYEIHLYALDTMLDLKNGFYFNELHKAMEGHILESVTLKGVYNQ